MLDPPLQRSQPSIFTDNPDRRPLPPGWREHFDEERRIWYYVNVNATRPSVSFVHPNDSSISPNTRRGRQYQESRSSTSPFSAIQSQKGKIARDLYASALTPTRKADLHRQEFETGDEIAPAYTPPSPVSNASPRSLSPPCSLPIPNPPDSRPLPRPPGSRSTVPSSDRPFSAASSSMTITSVAEEDSYQQELSDFAPSRMPEPTFRPRKQRRTTFPTYQSMFANDTAKYEPISKPPTVPMYSTRAAPPIMASNSVQTTPAFQSTPVALQNPTYIPLHPSFEQSQFDQLQIQNSISLQPPSVVAADQALPPAPAAVSPPQTFVATDSNPSSQSNVSPPESTIAHGARLSKSRHPQATTASSPPAPAKNVLKKPRVAPFSPSQTYTMADIDKRSSTEHHQGEIFDPSTLYTQPSHPVTQQTLITSPTTYQTTESYPIAQQSSTTSPTTFQQQAYHVQPPANLMVTSGVTIPAQAVPQNLQPIPQTAISMPQNAPIAVPPNTQMQNYAQPNNDPDVATQPLNSASDHKPMLSPETKKKLKKAGIAVGKTAGKAAFRFGTKALLASIGIPTGIFSSEDEDGGLTDVIVSGLSNMAVSAVSHGIHAAADHHPQADAESSTAGAQAISGLQTQSVQQQQVVYQPVQAPNQLQPTQQQFIPSMMGLVPTQAINLASQSQAMNYSLSSSSAGTSQQEDYARILAQMHAFGTQSGGGQQMTAQLPPPNAALSAPAQASSSQFIPAMQPTFNPQFQQQQYTMQNLNSYAMSGGPSQVGMAPAVPQSTQYQQLPPMASYPVQNANQYQQPSHPSTNVSSQASPARPQQRPSLLNSMIGGASNALMSTALAAGADYLMNGESPFDAFGGGGEAEA